MGNQKIKHLEVINITTTKTQVNEAIRAREVRVIAENGDQLGVKPLSEALEIAYAAGLDLVNVSPEAKPPVCKVLDYGKFRFEQQKKEKMARANQKTVEVKEVKLSTTIAEHDFNTKLRLALKFLEDKNKVKVSIQFRGRSIVHPEVGISVINRFIDACNTVGDPEAKPKLEGRSLNAMIKPKSSAI
jgi:translation initiation factor IF-3